MSTIDYRFANGGIWNMHGHTFNLWGRLSINELNKIAKSMSEKQTNTKTIF